MQAEDHPPRSAWTPVPLEGLAETMGLQGEKMLTWAGDSLKRVDSEELLLKFCPTCKEEQEVEGPEVAEAHGKCLDEGRGKSWILLIMIINIPRVDNCASLIVVPESGTNKTPVTS